MFSVYSRHVLDDNTTAIIAMAWARACGLPDDAFASDGPPRIVSASDTGVITVVQLLGRTLLHAPQWAIDRAESYTDEALLEVHGLLALAKDHNPHATRIAALLYADDYLGDEDTSSGPVTDDPQAVADLLTRCAPDDVDPDQLRAQEHIFVVLDDDDLPQAAAAYTAQQGIIADLVLVSAVDARGTGAVERAAAIAMHDALDEGLIPQLRVGLDEGRDLTTALGFSELGRIATVAVD